MLKFPKLQDIFRKNYTLEDTFGIQEKPTKRCQTYLVRPVHDTFKHAIMSTNIIVVYGESKQGKTWTIEKYCKNQLRIGCESNMNLNALKVAMLYKLGERILNIEHTVREQRSKKASHHFSIIKFFRKTNINSGFDHEKGKTYEREEVFKSVYPTININNTTQVITTISRKAKNNCFVLDNFHYLSPKVQQDFCSLLKDFNYNNVKIIIVGVWKEASRITSLAPDLAGRCQHIDIGSWKDEELKRVVSMGERALNIEISSNIIDRFVRCSVENIGIFKDLLQRYCMNCSIYETSKTKKYLSDEKAAESAIQSSYQEYYQSIDDRIKNLAYPLHEKRGSRHMRQKIVCAILRIICLRELKDIVKGIKLEEIQREVKSICSEKNELPLPESNITQELGILHTGEENRSTKRNFIPLFYYDKPNRKLLILEPGIYMIRQYSLKGLKQITNSIY